MFKLAETLDRPRTGVMEDPVRVSSTVGASRREKLKNTHQADTPIRDLLVEFYTSREYVVTSTPEPGISEQTVTFLEVGAYTTSTPTAPGSLGLLGHVGFIVKHQGGGIGKRSFSDVLQDEKHGRHAIDEQTGEEDKHGTCVKPGFVGTFAQSNRF